MSFSTDRCNNNGLFLEQLSRINHTMADSSSESAKEILPKISSFIENNRDFLLKDAQSAIELDSIAAKVRKISIDDPLLRKIELFTQQLLPSNTGESAKRSLNILRNAGADKINAIADWINQNKVQLSLLDLSQDELQQIFPHLEHIDLRGLDFNPSEIELLKINLRNPNIQFISDDNQQIVLAAMARHCAIKYPRQLGPNIRKFGIKDQNALIEIAKLLMRRSALTVGRYIQNFGIKDQEALCLIAKECLKKSPHMIAMRIDKFEIDDQTVLVKIARECAEKAPEKTAFNIQKFGIENRDVLRDIFRVCSNKALSATSKNIRKFGIEDQSVLVDIALKCVKESPSDICENIQYFGIKDQTVLVEIARECTDKVPWFVMRNLETFGIEDTTILEEIKQKCKTIEPMCVFVNFENFGTDSVAVLDEIKKICENEHFENMLSKIQRFGISDQRILFEIAKQYVKNDPLKLIENIHNFGIHEQSFVKELVNICVKKSPGITARCFKNFALKSQDDRIAIAKLFFEEKVFSLISNIQNFEIDDQKMLVELAKSCANKKPDFLANHIHTFGIMSQDDRFEIALICVNKNSSSLIRNIKKFGISDQKLLEKILRLLAHTNSLGLINSIHLFGIEDQSLLGELAMQMADVAPDIIPYFISNFGISDQETLVAIAKLCASQKPDLIVKCIENFGITDEEGLFEIAINCVRYGAFVNDTFREKFKINNRANLVEIAKIILRFSLVREPIEIIQVLGIHEHRDIVEVVKDSAIISTLGKIRILKKFKIDNVDALKQVFLQCNEIDRNLLFFIEKFSLAEEVKINFKEIIEHIEDVKKSDAIEEIDRNDLINKIDGLIGSLSLSQSSQSEVRAICEEIRNLTGHAQDAVIPLFLKSLALIGGMQKDSVDWMMASGLWSELVLLRDPNLRDLLHPLLFELSDEKVHRILFEDFLHQISNKISQKGKRGLMLLALPLYKLQIAGVDGDKLKSVTKEITKFRENRQSKFRDLKVVQTLIRTTVLLSTSQELSTTEKVLGFDKLFTYKVGNEKQLIKNILAVKGLLQLKDRNWFTSDNKLDVLFQQLFEKLIPLKDFKGDCISKYEEIFLGSRNSEALLSYASGLYSLADPALMNCLGAYVQTVFEGTFKEKRYQYDQAYNLHLATIFNMRSDLLQKWKKGLRMNLSRDEQSESATNVFTPKVWLRSALVVQKQLGDEVDLSHLYGFLNARSDADKKKIQRNINAEMQKILKVDENKTLRLQLKKEKDEDRKKILKNKLATLKNRVKNDPHLANLKLQKACIALADLKEGANVKVQIQALRRLKDTLKGTEKYRTSIFAQELDSTLKILQQPLKIETKDEKLYAIVTDDPIDLLLCGTDVSDSCQNVNGTPTLNQGLLGYLMDGKNKLVAIKGDKGKIVARCMLRLLWDGEGPVLYREKIYPHILSSDKIEALNDIAKKYAQELGIPLVGGEDKGIGIYGKPLQALGGPAPFEYSDAGGGLAKDGIFKIDSSYLQ